MANKKQKAFGPPQDHVDGTVRVPLSAEQLHAKGAELAQAEVKLEALKAEKRAATAKLRVEIGEVEKLVAVLAVEINTKSTEVSAQQALFRGDEPKNGTRKNAGGPVAEG